MKTHRRKRSPREWEDIIRRARSSGKDLTKWCKDRGISIRAFYYWEKKLREEKKPKAGYEDIGFVEVNEVGQTGSEQEKDLTSFSGTVLQYGGINILVTEQTSETAIAKVIRGIRNA
jgi:hypothetical protein